MIKHVVRNMALQPASGKVGGVILRGGVVGVGQVKAVNVEIQIVLGRAILPMQQLLRMGRGAVIPLDAGVTEEVWILANNHPIARGEIQINEDRISIAVTREANVYDYLAGSL